MTSAGRDARGKFARTLKGAERDREAVRLRAHGRTYQQISDELKYGGHQNARRAVKSVLATIDREAAEEHIAIQLERLDFMYDAAIQVLEAEHYTVSDGRLVYLGDPKDPDNPGAPLLDDGPVLKAIDRLLRIEERRSKLLGLDAPAKTTITHAAADVDAAIAELAREMSLRPAPAEQE